MNEEVSYSIMSRRLCGMGTASVTVLWGPLRLFYDTESGAYYGKIMYRGVDT